MASLIKLRSPEGDVRAYDVEEYDIPSMLDPKKGGYKRAGSVMIPAHTRSVALSRQQKERLTPQEIKATGASPALGAVQREPREEPGIVKALPAVGGFVGGVVGGVGGTVGGVGVGGVPGAVGGAAVGGAGGEAARQLIDHFIGAEAPETALQAASRIGQEGATQGALEAAGAGVAKGVAVAGRPIMQAAIKAAPETAKAAIKAGLTRTVQGGEKLMTLLGEHGQRVKQMVGLATQQGHQIAPINLLRTGESMLENEVKMLGGQVGGRMPEAAGDLKVYSDLSSDFLARQFTAGTMVGPGGVRIPIHIPKGPLTPSVIEELGTKFDEVARPIWQRIARGDKDVPGVDLARARWYKNMAQAMREWLEQVTPTMIDPVTRKPITLAEQNQIGQTLIKLKDHILPAKNEGGIAARIAARTAGPVIGAGVGAAMPGNRSANALYGLGAGAALTSPEALSWLALRLNGPVVGQILRQVPRAVGYAAQPDQTQAR